MIQISSGIRLKRKISYRSTAIISATDGAVIYLMGYVDHNKQAIDDREKIGADFT